MFLEATIKNNSGLIEAAYSFYKNGKIGPNTYCIDLDMVRKNASLIAETAKKYGLKLYFMTKQFGRNPVIARAVVESGIEKAVAVDIDEARVLYKNGIKVGHIGHLVQIPKNYMKEALSMMPEVVTCFSVDKAKQVNEAAQELGVVQDILLRVIDDGDYIYPGQEGGIALSNLEKVATEIKKMNHIRIVGVTSFPCLLYNEQTDNIEPTKNMITLKKAKEILMGMGIQVTHINAPSVTSVSSIPLLNKMGVTHGEPGHALTGTTPLHAAGNQPEGQAMIYITEVSHRDEKRAYVFGGGFYHRSKMKKAYSPVLNTLFDVEEISPEAIDYYGTIIDEKRLLSVGDVIIFSFRTQVFVTRAKVAIIEGISKGLPHLIGVYNSIGDELR